MKFVNIGIVGCGNVARIHAQAVIESEVGILRGVADGSYDRAAGFAAEFGTTAYRTVEEMLADPLVDAVCICTPSGYHASCAIDAMKAGKHVLVEKPIAMNTAECDEMIALRDKMNLTAGAICQYRFTDVIQVAKKLIDDDKLGKIITVNLSMCYHRTAEYYRSSPWRGTWALDGGSIMNQGIHGVDALLYLLGDVDQVYSVCRTLHHEIEAEDTTVAAVAFKSGALGVIQCTTAVQPGYPRLMTIAGTKGSLQIQEEMLRSCDVEGCDELEKQLSRSANNGYNQPMGIGIRGHVLQINDFIDAIRTHTQPAVSLEDARRTIQLINRLYENYTQ